MTIKGGILLVFLILLTGTLAAQKAYSFFVKIPDKNNIPSVSHSMDGIRKTYTNTKDGQLNKLLNSYKIYSCEKVFKSSKRASLKNMYLIECSNKTLMNDLMQNYKHVYPRIESAEGEVLHVPNDFGTTGGAILDQEELNYIRAKESWDITTGSSDIIIGVSDTSVDTSHEDLTKVSHVFGRNPASPYNGSNHHGSRVISIAAANTNNGKGMSAIGYNSTVYAATNNWVVGVDTLSLMPGVKVINTAWISSAMPDVYDDVAERGVVVVGSAGNNNTGDPTDYIYPAAFKNVISVSAIAHKTQNVGSFNMVKDNHSILYQGEPLVYQHNDSVDIVAPAYRILSALPLATSTSSYYYETGTSFASPMVSGTVGLMFDVNYCLDPKEVETILKLTAVKIDTLPQNIQYHGKLGAGKLDAYEAVKMAKDMADATGTVEVKNRILYRPWFYKLETAPYEIKMTNNNVTGGSKLKFKARNNIEILSGDYYPDTSGYIDLSIDNTLALDCPPSPISSVTFSQKTKTKINNISEGILEENRILVFPNPSKDLINIVNKESLKEVSIIDISDKIYYHLSNINTKEISIDISNFDSGIYFLKLKRKTGEISVKKIIRD